jgi:uncharacterized membrane protein
MRNPDRLVLFSDAVVAIAITLLVLPLVEVVGEDYTKFSARELISENRQAIGTFLLSFVVIATFWLGHHRLFEHVRAYTTGMMRLNLLWLLTIVFLPFPTEIVGRYDSSQFTAGLYTGTILVLSLCQSALTYLVHGHKELEDPEDPVGQSELVSSLWLTGLTLVAFVLAAFVPGVAFNAMFLLVLTPVVMQVRKLRERKVSSRTRTGARESD